MSISRRAFGQGIGAAMLLHNHLAHALAATRILTAATVVERIKAKMESDGIPWATGFPWKPTDGFKYGDPETPVTGIAFTFQATFDVLKKAARAKKNLVISHERMFWDHIDDVGTLAEDKRFEVASALETDPVLVAKRNFCEDNHLVVWRFHDHEHMLKPDPIMAGLVAKLGWQDNVVPVEGQMIPIAFVLPETSLREVARHVARSIASPNVRVIGDPEMPVRRVGLGAHKLVEILKPLHTCDVVLMSEPQDCDAFPYLRDGLSLGLPHPKGLIAIPHERFEEWAEIMPAWLGLLVPEVPIAYISAGDPYWTLHQDPRRAGKTAAE